MIEAIQVGEADFTFFVCGLMYGFWLLLYDVSL